MKVLSFALQTARPSPCLEDLVEMKVSSPVGDVKPLVRFAWYYNVVKFIIHVIYVRVIDREYRRQLRLFLEKRNSWEKSLHLQQEQTGCHRFINCCFYAIVL